MDFTLTIATDAPEMGHARNVARALERLAHELDQRFPLDGGEVEGGGVLRSVSGAIVGRWELRCKGR